MDNTAKGSSMDRSFAKLAAALLLGTALTACSTFTPSGNPAPKDVSKGTTAPKSMAADVDAQVRNAQAARATGDYAGATKILSQLMLVTPDNPRVVAEYGKTLVQQGRSKEALEFLKRAVQLTPGDWSIYSATGVAYDQGGDYANARVAYQQALAIQPGNPSVLNNFALSRMQAGDLTGAHQLMAQLSPAGAADPKIAQNVALLASLSPMHTATQPLPAKTTVAASTPGVKQMPVTTRALPLPANVVAQKVPVDPKAGPVHEANGAPHQLAKNAAPAAEKAAVRTAVKAEPKKVATTAPKKIDAHKTPALRMTADAASP
ncbi:MAG TPA: tetratricopeptide repeat protein [Rhizomicrobium sp.]|nr:tetratricopeptide repeat protein [Rhizomicrobium sp.]